MYGHFGNLLITKIIEFERVEFKKIRIFLIIGGNYLILRYLVMIEIIINLEVNYNILIKYLFIRNIYLIGIFKISI